MDNRAGGSDVSRLPRSVLPRPVIKTSSTRFSARGELYVPRTRLRPPVDMPKESATTESIQAQNADDLDSKGITKIESSKDETRLGQSSSQGEFAKPSSTPIARRRPRPSLSERTIETLSLIPPSPSPQLRKSGHVSNERPLSSLSRPTSSLSLSRSGPSMDQHPPTPLTPRGMSSIKRGDQSVGGSPLVDFAANRRSITSSTTRSLPRGSTRPYNVSDTTPSKVPPVPKLPSAQALKLQNNQILPKANSRTEQRDQTNESALDRFTSLNDAFLGRSHNNGPAHRFLKPGSGAKTFSISSTKQRPALDDVFTQQPPFDPSNVPKKITKVPAEGFSATKTVKYSKEQPRIAVSKTKPSVTASENKSVTSQSADPSLKDSPKSSAALRETIAKAKAARRAAIKSSESKPEFQNEFNPGLKGTGIYEDKTDPKKVLRDRLSMARTSGRLNIAALGLKQFPEEVKDMYSLENLESTESKWYESVDLTRLIAADNEFEMFEDWVFPDILASEVSNLEDNFVGNMFRGLETLDLHGNKLIALPDGIRQLERLVTLNLSKNNLTNKALELLDQIPSLRELRLSENRFDGACLDYLRHLNYLELLDICDNALSNLSCGISELTSLRVLLIAGNKLASIPFEILQFLPLKEIDASRNKLSGVLIPHDVDRLSLLKSIDVSKNALSILSEKDTINLPLLEVFNVAENKLTSIPEMSGWQNLIVFSAGGNNINHIPEGLTSLPKLRSLDLTRNNLKKLDNRIGLMDSLAVLLIANNPLRERRHLSLNTEELKQELRDRDISVETTDIVEISASSALPSHSSTVEEWLIKPGGIMDLSSAKLNNIESSSLRSILCSGDVKTLILHHNLFPCIPSTIECASAWLTTLDLSHNKLAGATYISHSFSLQSLKTLDLSSNSISSIAPLLTSLSLPLLSTLHINYNRLTTLPILRMTYPLLTNLFMANNSLTELDVKAVRGLEVLDVSGNSIGHLDPRLGLLAEQGLRTILVGANVFRVPRREVVEKGTGALLAWLKDKIPAEEAEA